MTSKVSDFVRLIRLPNLIIIFITQAFAYYFLTPSVSVWQLLQADFISLLLSTFLVAAGGYIINDYMDVMLDLLNKPDKVIVGKSISRRWAMLLHLGMNLIAVILAMSISKKIALMVLACSLALWGYSQLLKKTYLAGNILVALLTAFTLWILFVFDPNIMKAGILVYSFFAFASTLIREIIKDTEDLRGDQKFKCKTLPIVLGVRKTKKVLYWLQLIFLSLTLIYCFLFPALSLSSNTVYMLFLAYMAMFVILPMVMMIWMIRNADVKKDFTRLSLLSKITMVTGIISMVFWRF